MCCSASYHFIVFRGKLEDTSQLGIHEIIGFCIFPLVEMKNGHVILQLKLLAAGFYPHTCMHTHFNLLHTIHMQCRLESMDITVTKHTV